MLVMFQNLASAKLPLNQKNLQKQKDDELTIQGITIGKSTLNDVKKKFKTKEILLPLNPERLGVASMSLVLFLLTDQ